MLKPKHLLIALIASLISPVRAETITPDNAPNSKAFLTYAASAPMVNEAILIARRFDEKFQLEQSCKTPYAIKSLNVNILKPVNYIEGKGAREGAWKLRFLVSRCNSEKMYNMIFVAQPSGNPLVVPYFPGVTLANYALVKDANETVLMGASVLTKKANCQDMSIFDMVVSKNPVIDAKSRKSGEWEENWTVQACGERVVVPVKFVPDADGKGTSFTISVKPIKR